MKPLTFRLIFSRKDDIRNIRQKACARDISSEISQTMAQQNPQPTLRTQTELIIYTPKNGNSLISHDT
jgi:hypothetical protein